MKRLNCFISYYHKDDQKYVEDLRKVYQRITVSDYSLKKDISYKSEEQIYEHIKYQMNHCAIAIILVGKNTGTRKWIDWEIWAALEPFRNKTIKYRDGFRPCGILAIFLPSIKHYSIPKRLQDNIDSGYAVKMSWESIMRDKNFLRKLTIANRKRRKPMLINNNRKRTKRNTTSFLRLKL